ncbi:MAG: transcriptional regulator [Rhodospirillales bacterium]|jgi:predicted XRE-type DNA-binding protein|nr:transcriptional regulator [Rhodospirillales bacterium]
MKVTRSSGNVFANIGFDKRESDELAAKADLITLVSRAIQDRALTQEQAARLCGTDQPTLSKALRGRLESVTIDRLTRWIVALGGRVRITVEQPRTGSAQKGSVTVQRL